MVVDLFLVYQFIRRLATPFEKWPAYELGIIDKEGNILKKRKELNLSSERKAFGVFDLMILNIKKLLAKLPGGSSRIASYAAALYLIREWNHFSKDSLLTEDISDEQLNESIELFYDRYINYTTLIEDVNTKEHLDSFFEQRFSEDAPTMSAGSGAIAGIGVGPDGEPGLTPTQMRRYKKKNTGPKKLRDIIGVKL